MTYDGIERTYPFDKSIHALAPEMSERQRMLLACDCAEYVLPIFENHYPNDGRPRNLTEALKQYANGEISIKELNIASSKVREIIDDNNIIDSAKFAAIAVVSTMSGYIWTVIETNRAATSALFVSARERGVAKPIDEVMEFKEWQIQRAQAILDGLYDQE